jgi:pSer/pThr/pTyr-binding forkhead associated (FHA) protein/regulator of replication initiation timing
MFNAAAYEQEQDDVIISPEVVIAEIRDTGKKLADALPDDIADDIRTEIDRAEELLQRVDTPRSGRPKIQQRVQELVEIVAEVRPLQADVDKAQRDLETHLQLEERLQTQVNERLFYPSRDGWIDAYEGRLSDIMGRGSRRDVHSAIKDTDEYRGAIYRDSTFISALDTNELYELGMQAKGSAQSLEALIAQRIALKGGQRAVAIMAEVERGNIAIDSVIDKAIDKAEEVVPRGDSEELIKLGNRIASAIDEAKRRNKQDIFDPTTGREKTVGAICSEIEDLATGYRVPENIQIQADTASKVRRAITQLNEARTDAERIDALRKIDAAKSAIDNITNIYNSKASEDQKKRFRAIQKQLDTYEANSIIRDYDRYTEGRDDYYRGLTKLKGKDSSSQVVRELADGTGVSLRGIMETLEESVRKGNILSAQDILRAQRYYYEVRQIPERLAEYKKARRAASDDLVENINSYVSQDSQYVKDLATLARKIITKEERRDDLVKLAPMREQLQQKREDLNNERQLQIQQRRGRIQAAVANLQSTISEVDEQADNVRAVRLQATNMVLVKDPETGRMVEKPMPLLLTAGETQEERDRKVATAEHVVYGKGNELFPPLKIITVEDLPSMLQALEDINAQFPWLQQIGQSVNGNGDVEDTAENRLVDYYWRLRDYIASQVEQANLQLEKAKLQEQVSDLSEQVQYQIAQRQAMVNAYMSLDEQRRASVQALNDELAEYQDQLEQANISLEEKRIEEERITALLTKKEELLQTTQERLENADITSAGLRNVVTIIEQLPTILAMQEAKNDIVGSQLIVPVSKKGDRTSVIVGRTAMGIERIEMNSVSRTHFKVSSEGKGFVIQDLQSTNGTFVNGERINTPTKLSTGDIIRIGKAESPVYYVVTPGMDGDIELVYIAPEQVAAIDNIMEQDDKRAKINALRVIRQNARLYNDFYEEQKYRESVENQLGIEQRTVSRLRQRLQAAQAVVGDALQFLNKVNIVGVADGIMARLKGLSFSEK